MQSSAFIYEVINGIKKRIRLKLANQNAKADLTWWKEIYLKHASEAGVKAFSYKLKKIYYKRPVEFLYALKEIFIEEIYKINLTDHPYIIDCGSNIGLSIIYFKEKFPSAEILCFEPDESNYQLLIKNIASFQLKNIKAKKVAVWVNNEELSFSNTGTMASKIDKANTTSRNTIQAIRLKNLLNRKIDLLKIDIEGAEYEVLKDIEDQLNLVSHLFVEYHGTFKQNNELLEILNIIHRSGFCFYIKEAADIYSTPLIARNTKTPSPYDIQLNIFCFR